MKNEATVFRLINGESVIGTILQENEKTFTVFRPYSIQAFIVGETPLNSKEVVSLRDWMKYSIDLNTTIDKKNILNYYTPDPKIVELYESKKDTDDGPKPSTLPLFPNIEQMVSDAISDIDEDEIEKMINSFKNNPITEQEMFNVNIPMNEDFFKDFMDLIGIYQNPEGDINKTPHDDIDFVDDVPEKYNDPDEFGNHFGHWPLDPKDLL